MQIEALDDVERAFVHVDYAPRELPEHKARGDVDERLRDQRSPLWDGPLACWLFDLRIDVCYAISLWDCEDRLRPSARVHPAQ